MSKAIIEARAPGWDAKEIARVAKSSYGGFQQMFEAHGWSERGTAMMPAVQRRVAETYGDIGAFAQKHTDGGNK